MGSYEIYKAYGRCVSLKEISARFFLITAKWYEKPYYKFIIWKERVKRYLGAEIKLPHDNPFNPFN